MKTSTSRRAGRMDQQANFAAQLGTDAVGTFEIA